MNSAFIVFAAYIADLVFGDPISLPHPVRLIGKLITTLEMVLRKLLPAKPFWEKIGGGVLAIIVIFLSFSVTYFILRILYGIYYPLGFCVEIFFCYQILAVKSLKDGAMNVYKPLIAGDIKSARENLSMIVGRDTASLDEAGISRATVETVAENTSDGVIAPLIFIIIGGAPLGFLYKSINTMDSMIGYKNEKYINFGMVAARIDDVANFIPARVTALLYVLSAFILRFNWRGAIDVWFRDGGKHSSPNSGRIEAACAGALNIRLGGPSYYFGKYTEKSFIGDDTRRIVPQDIVSSIKLLYASSFIGTTVLCCLSVAIS